jgi:hypothetical protein
MPGEIERLLQLLEEQNEEELLNALQVASPAVIKQFMDFANNDHPETTTDQQLQRIAGLEKSIETNVAKAIGIISNVIRQSGSLQ